MNKIITPMPELIKKRQGEYEYQAQFDDVIALFNDASESHTHLFAVQKGSKFVKFELDGINASSTEVLANGLHYPNIFPDVDLEYQIEQGAVKETFFINKPEAKHEFSFKVVSGCIKTRLQEDGAIECICEDSNETLWTIAAPIAWDANKNPVEVEMIYSEDSYSLTAIPDENTVYPIFLDPTINIGTMVVNLHTTSTSGTQQVNIWDASSFIPEGEVLTSVNFTVLQSDTATSNAWNRVEFLDTNNNVLLNHGNTHVSGAMSYNVPEGTKKLRFTSWARQFVVNRIYTVDGGIQVTINSIDTEVDGIVVENNYNTMRKIENPEWYYTEDFESGTLVNTEKSDNGYILSSGVGYGTLFEDFEGTPVFNFTGNWLKSSVRKYQGTWSFANNSIGHNGVTNATTTVKIGPGGGNVSYFRAVSSEANYDFFRFLINNVQQEILSGNQLVFGKKIYTLPEGTHTLTFRYSKDGSGTVGDDRAYIDNLEVTNVETEISHMSGSVISAPIDVSGINHGDKIKIKISGITYDNTSMVAYYSIDNGATWIPTPSPDEFVEYANINNANSILIKVDLITTVKGLSPELHGVTILKEVSSIVTYPVELFLDSLRRTTKNSTLYNDSRRKVGAQNDSIHDSLRKTTVEAILEADTSRLLKSAIDKSFDTDRNIYDSFLYETIWAPGVTDLNTTPTDDWSGVVVMDGYDFGRVMAISYPPMNLGDKLKFRLDADIPLGTSINLFVSTNPDANWDPSAEWIPVDLDTYVCYEMDPMVTWYYWIKAEMHRTPDTSPVLRNIFVYREDGIWQKEVTKLIDTARKVSKLSTVNADTRRISIKDALIDLDTNRKASNELQKSFDTSREVVYRVDNVSDFDTLRYFYKTGTYSKPISPQLGFEVTSSLGWSELGVVDKDLREFTTINEKLLSLRYTVAPFLSSETSIVARFYDSSNKLIQTVNISAYTSPANLIVPTGAVRVRVEGKTRAEFMTFARLRFNFTDANVMSMGIPYFYDYDTTRQVADKGPYEVKMDTARKVSGPITKIFDTRRQITFEKLLHTEMFDPWESKSNSVIFNNGITLGTESYGMDVPYTLSAWQAQANGERWRQFTADNNHSSGKFSFKFVTQSVANNNFAAGFADRLHVYIGNDIVRTITIDSSVQSGTVVADIVPAWTGYPLIGPQPIWFRYVPSSTNTTVRVTLSEVKMINQAGTRQATSGWAISRPFDVSEVSQGSTVKFLADRFMPVGSNVKLLYATNGSTNWKEITSLNEYKTYTDINGAASLRFRAELTGTESAIPKLTSINMWYRKLFIVPLLMFLDTFRKAHRGTVINNDSLRVTIKDFVYDNDTNRKTSAPETNILDSLRTVHVSDMNDYDSLRTIHKSLDVNSDTNRRLHQMLSNDIETLRKTSVSSEILNDTTRSIMASEDTNYDTLRKLHREALEDKDLLRVVHVPKTLLGETIRRTSVTDLKELETLRTIHASINSGSDTVRSIMNKYDFTADTNRKTAAPVENIFDTNRRVTYLIDLLIKHFDTLRYTYRSTKIYPLDPAAIIDCMRTTAVSGKWTHTLFLNSVLAPNERPVKIGVRVNCNSGSSLFVNAYDSTGKHLGGANMLASGFNYVDFMIPAGTHRIVFDANLQAPSGQTAFVTAYIRNLHVNVIGFPYINSSNTLRSLHASQEALYDTLRKVSNTVTVNTYNDTVRHVIKSEEGLLDTIRRTAITDSFLNDTLRQIVYSNPAGELIDTLRTIHVSTEADMDTSRLTMAAHEELLDTNRKTSLDITTINDTLRVISVESISLHDVYRGIIVSNDSVIDTRRLTMGEVTVYPIDTVRSIGVTTENIYDTSRLTAAKIYKVIDTRRMVVLGDFPYAKHYFVDLFVEDEGFIKIIRFKEDQR